MSEHFVIVGGGQAATQAAGSARQSGYDGRITLISDEPNLPYQRPPLSKAFLAGLMEADRLLLKPEQFYETREIDLHLGTRVTEIRIGESRVGLDDGSELAYSELLIATGSEPRRLEIPGHELEGICYLRSIADVEAIRNELEENARLLIIGAGYIGLEVAAVATQKKLSVTVLEAGSHAMSRTVCPDVANFFADYHRAAGVDIRFDTSVTAFIGDSRVVGVETAAGDRLSCDFVIVAIGILPRVALADAAGLTIDNGIAVDPCGRTSVANVLAAGDCTSHPHPWVGERVRLESVQNAIEQGKAVAASLRGQDSPFDAIPWFWSDQYDLKLQIAGLSTGYDETVTRGSMDDGSFSVFYLASGRVIACDSVNDPRSFIAAKQALVGKPEWAPDAIADPDCDLTELGN
jgi:3-phenylpropionate/trans-cinnamate dioxygenase ferredoxin reductase subunit